MIIEKFIKQVVTAAPYQSIAQVAGLMEHHNVGAVVIVESRRPVGIVTDRDLALELALRATPVQTPIVKVMSTPIETIHKDEGVFCVTEAFKDHKVRRLAVVDDDGQLCGLVAVDDVVRVLSLEMANLAAGIQDEMTAG